MKRDYNPFRHGKVLIITAFACGGGLTEPIPTDDPRIFEDVTDANLPGAALAGLSMDAEVADIDADGDLDIVIAHEFQPNILLRNDGFGRFIDASAALPAAFRDSEDVGFGDFNGDTRLDIVIVSEDDQVNEMYFGTDGGFTDEGHRWPVTGVSNAVLVSDIDLDGDEDLIVGNNGQNRIVTNDGTGSFDDETALRLPVIDDVTQDLELGDVDADGDLDLLVGNEIGNRLLINDGTGVFTDESATRIPFRASVEETREADFGDVDGDGDLDIIFANTRSSLPQADVQNRLLINDGDGFYSDQTSDRLPVDQDRSFEADFVDLDGDGDLDLIFGNLGTAPTPYRVYLNDGSGFFADGTSEIMPNTARGFGFDVEAADFDQDGLLDLFLASRGSVDRLLLGGAGS